MESGGNFIKDAGADGSRIKMHGSGQIAQVRDEHFRHGKEAAKTRRRTRAWLDF
jgi:hypothetical protein